MMSLGKRHRKIRMNRRSKSFIPLTRFCVYCTTSEKRKAKADAETSAVRDLLRFLSNILGLRLGFGFTEEG